MAHAAPYHEFLEFVQELLVELADHLDVLPPASAQQRGGRRGRRKAWERDAHSIAGAGGRTEKSVLHCSIVSSTDEPREYACSGR